MRKALCNKKKLCLQIAALIAAVAVFAVTDGVFYRLVTYRCVTNFGTARQAKMIEPEKYLPFDDDAELVRIDSSLKLAGDDLPVLDGATALLPVYAAVVNAVYPADSCAFDGEQFLPESRMQYRNTVGAYRALVDGEADVIFCAAPSEEQKAYAAERGVTLTLTPIGREAFVFFVNVANPVSSLTQEQVRGIYSGQYRNWAQLGGARRPIHALQRPAGSGSQSAMLRFMGDIPLRTAPGLGLLGGAIGYSFRYYTEGIVADSGVKMLALDGALPTEENIRNGTYPIVSNFYAVTRADDPDPNVALLLTWLVSDEGQQIVNGSGYVGVK